MIGLIFNNYIKLLEKLMKFEVYVRIVKNFIFLLKFV